MFTDTSRRLMSTSKSPVSPSTTQRRENTIEVSNRDLEQFFNTIDPSPFHEKDLDHDLEEFIVSWAMAGFFANCAPYRLKFDIPTLRLRAPQNEPPGDFPFDWLASSTSRLTPVDKGR
jgi:hypothetical protein